MSKYIDADLCEQYFYEHMDDKAMEIAMIAINDMPAADVAEVRHGMWKGLNKNKYNDDEATCSICGVTFSSGYSDPAWWDYCPNCGAKMEGEQNG